MKIELRVEGRTVVIEAAGAVSVQVLEDAAAASFAEAAPAGFAELGGEAPAPVSGAELFERLALLRRELAAAEGVPPFVVFKDDALREMAEKCPQDIAGFSAIGGVGKAKLEKYGAAFLAAINEGMGV